MEEQKLWLVFAVRNSPNIDRYIKQKPYSKLDPVPWFYGAFYGRKIDVQKKVEDMYDLRPGGSYAVSAEDMAVDVPLPYSGVYCLSLREIGLPARAYNALGRAGYKLVGDLANQTEKRISHVRNIGEGTLNTIKDKMTELGVGFKPNSQ